MQNSIRIAGEDAVRSITAAATAATAAIARTAEESAKTLATAAAAATAALHANDGRISLDHDLLIALNVKVEEIKVAIHNQDAKDDTHVTKLEIAPHLVESKDHETRIRVLEASMWKWVGISSLGGAIVSIAIALVLKLIK